MPIFQFAWQFGSNVKLLELRVALAALDPDHREILFLKYVEELTVAEIARVVSASEHAVESRLARARRALKKLLAKRQSFNPGFAHVDAVQTAHSSFASTLLFRRSE